MHQQQIKITRFHILKNVKIVQNKSLDELEYLTNKAIVIDQDGKIVAIVDDKQEFLEKFMNDCEITILKDENVLIPGMIDTHVHAPQFAFTGTGYDLPLLEWLNKYTFPCESRFKDLDFARKVFSKSIKSHLRNGTTTICYFATIHKSATSLLADLIEQIGIRGFVGKVCMDRNSPEWYQEKDSATSIKDTLSFIQYLKAKNSTIVPVITPRFAITSTSEQLTQLGELAKQNEGMFIQTHLSENQNEIEFIKQLFPECSSYTDVYYKHGLLTNKTILAHCVYLSNEEIAIIKKTDSGISHCPISNTFIQSGIMPLRKYIQEGLKIGLGTDVAGGYSTSMFEVIRHCIGVSKLKFLQQSELSPITIPEAFYMATIGGAKLLGLEDKVGKIEVGKEFDALLIDSSKLHDTYIESNASLEEIFQKIIFFSNPTCIEKIWCRGQSLNSQY